MLLNCWSSWAQCGQVISNHSTTFTGLSFVPAESRELSPVCSINLAWRYSSRKLLMYCLTSSACDEIKFFNSSELAEDSFESFVPAWWLDWFEVSLIRSCSKTDCKGVFCPGKYNSRASTTVIPKAKPEPSTNFSCGGLTLRITVMPITITTR